MHHRIEQLRQAFSKSFGDAAKTLIAQAPGRVNIIGEHTDYNNGYVLPIAIDRTALVMFRPNNTRTVNITSVNYAQSASFDLDDPAGAPTDQWMRYPFGVAHVLQEAGHPVPGIDAAVEGNVPLGGGLSSSAAIEVAFALAWCEAGHLDIDRLALAKLCRKAENKYAGVNCGIMDQYVSLFAEKDSATFIDCRSLEHKSVPFHTDAVKLVVSDTGVRHSLAGSEYNIRREQCERGVEFFKRHIERVSSLRDVAPDDVQTYAGELPSPLFERCRHVVTENLRTIAAVKALNNRNMYQLGVLMSASHQSLKNDYAVSCKELDTMVSIAEDIKGVFGSRMTGGGFGGCTVTLVAAEHVRSFSEELARRYEAATGINPKILIVSAEAGARLV